MSDDNEPYINMAAMADDLRVLGWTIERRSRSRLVATHPEQPTRYEVFGDDEIVEGCCYVNGVMVDWASLDAIRPHLGKWAKDKP